MNYQLAKKLKDAGFPWPQGWKEDRKQKSITDELGFYPTLEELIAACGGQILLYVNGDDCRVESINPITLDGDAYNPMWKTPVKGKTPIEVLANLWLVLNKK